MFVDFMYSDEQIDRKGIITGMLENRRCPLFLTVTMHLMQNTYPW